jgi:hypothetical protein
MQGHGECAAVMALIFYMRSLRSEVRPQRTFPTFGPKNKTLS